MHHTHTHHLNIQRAIKLLFFALYIYYFIKIIESFIQSVRFFAFFVFPIKADKIDLKISILCV